MTYSSLSACGHGIIASSALCLAFFPLINDLNDILLIVFCQLTDCFSISVQGNTLAVIHFSHYCCVQTGPIHQSVGSPNNWSEALKPVGALVVHSALHNEMIKWLTPAL